MERWTAEDYQDLGQYLLGLLQIMAADNHLHERQKDLIRSFALDQGFEKGYIERAISTVLENPHIPRVPPRFHSRHTAQVFLEEAARIAVADGLLHPLERNWIVNAARINNLPLESVQEILDSAPLSANRPE